MATIQSYTNLTTPDGIEEIVVADVTNSNVTRNITTKVIIEDRHLSKSVAGSANVALTAAEALYGQLTFTGGLTGNINVTVPDNSARTYIVHNNTTGSFTLTMKTVTGSGVAITQGNKALITVQGTTTSEPMSSYLFAAGTSLVFYQATAPTGWTEDTVQAKSALQVVSVASGTGGTSGGTHDLDSPPSLEHGHLWLANNGGQSFNSSGTQITPSSGNNSSTKMFYAGGVDYYAPSENLYTNKNALTAFTPKRMDVIVCKKD